MILFPIIFFFYLNKGISSKIQFRFEKYKINNADINSLLSRSFYKENSVNKNDFMFRLLTDDLYFNLTVGSPPQIIPTIWNMNKYSFKIYSGSYNFNKSNTYKEMKPFVYSFDEVKKAFLCEDIFYFTDENNEIFSSIFNFINLENNNNNYSFIGLQLPEIISENLLIFYY